MNMIEYQIQCRRLYEHCERIFVKSGNTRFTTVRKAAKALRLRESTVSHMAEDLHDQGLLIVNVAVGIQCHGVAGLPRANWELEPVEIGAKL